MSRILLFLSILFLVQASQATYKDWQEWFEGSAHFDYAACEKVESEFTAAYKANGGNYRSEEILPLRKAMYQCKVAASQSLFQKFIRFGDTRPLKSQGSSAEIAVLPMSVIQDLYKELRANPYLPYEVIETQGCFNRASFISLYLFSRGLMAGQVVADGKLRVDSILDSSQQVSWKTHTAPFVLNEKNERIVIDPSLSDVPLTVKEWTGKMTRESALGAVKLSFDKSYFIEGHLLPAFQKNPYAPFDESDAFTRLVSSMSVDLFHLLNEARPQRERHTPDLLPALVEYASYRARRVPNLEGPSSRDR